MGEHSMAQKWCLSYIFIFTAINVFQQNIKKYFLQLSRSLELIFLLCLVSEMIENVDAGTDVKFVLFGMNHFNGTERCVNFMQCLKLLQLKNGNWKLLICKHLFTF